MPENVQPGVKIDPSVWEAFREKVKERKGGIRGHLRNEVETALRLYIADDTEVSAIQVNQRLSRIESEMGIAESDGGIDTLEAVEHTHAPSVDEKPSANAPTDKKVAYLTACVEDEATEDPDELPKKLLVETVKEEYAFRSDTAKRYVERLIDSLGLVTHPEIDGMLVSPEKKDTLVEERREEIKTQAEQEL
jgi:hypothetical protein